MRSPITMDVLNHLRHASRVSFPRRFRKFSSASSATGANKAEFVSSLDEKEKTFFQNLSDKWWQPNGEFKALLSYNELRIPLVRDSYITHCLRETPTSVRSRLDSPFPLKGARILDVGCGGGLLSEPMAKLGAQVTGIDVVEENVEHARLHWEEYLEKQKAKKGSFTVGSILSEHDLPSDGGLEYICSTVEDFCLQSPKKFDLVVCSEVIEHVNGVNDFVASLGSLVRPGGVAVFSTINRTLASFVGAIVAAEYILRLVPRGTHHWNKLVTPDELDSMLRKNGFATRLIHGALYNPLVNRWYWGSFTGVNYALVAVKLSEPAGETVNKSGE